MNRIIPWEKVEQISVGVRPIGPGLAGSQPVFIKLDPQFAREVLPSGSVTSVFYKISQGVGIETRGLDIDGKHLAQHCRDYLAKTKEREPNV